MYYYRKTECIVEFLITKIPHTQEEVLNVTVLHTILQAVQTGLNHSKPEWKGIALAHTGERREKLFGYELNKFT